MDCFKNNIRQKEIAFSVKETARLRKFMCKKS